MPGRFFRGIFGHFFLRAVVIQGALGLAILAVVLTLFSYFSDRMAEEQGRTFSNSTLAATIDSIYKSEYGSVIDYCMGIMKNTPNVNFIIYSKKDGAELHIKPDGWYMENKTSTYYTLPFEKEEVASRSPFVLEDSGNLFSPANSYVFSRPIVIGGQHWGVMSVGFSKEAYFSSIINFYIFVTAVGVLIGLLSLYFFRLSTRRIRSQLKAIEEVALKFSEGQLSVNAPENGIGEIGTLGLSLNSMSHALQEKSDRMENLARTKSQFLANMSHEIRTPMNGIIGLSHLALNKDMPLEVRDYLEKINQSSQSLLGILNDILDFSKIEAGRLQIDNHRFNLDHILENMQNLFSHYAEEKNLDFAIEVDQNVPVELIGDALRLQQILSNLLSNAIKFTEHGKIACRIKLLDAEESEVRLFFSVCDSGIGMSPKDQAKLFQPFSQVDTSSKRRFGGTGLGLAISRNLLVMMDSDLHVESDLGKGTTFSFDLLFPVASYELHQELNRRHQGPQAGTLSRDLKKHGKTLSGTRILVAEDNSINQQVIREFLQMSGVHVEIANNGKEALRLLEQHTYDAVLMDAHMPEMDGIEATKYIRCQDALKDLPIIALTAGVTLEERENCLASGMNDFIAKPVIPEVLIETLSKWIKKDLQKPQAENSDDNWVSIEQSLPDFDLANLKKLIGGDSHLLVSMLQTFMEDCTKTPTMIRQALQEDQLAVAKKHLHKLKGAAGSLGAIVLHQASEELDGQLKAGLYTPETLAKWQSSLDATIQEIAKLTSRFDKSPE